MQLVNFSENTMMSSKQIAERTKKRHSDVLRDIRNMLTELQSEDDAKLHHQEYQVINDTRGYDAEIKLNERLSLCLAAGYSVTLRMMIIDDWAEMKAKGNVIPQSFAEALQLAANQAAMIEAQQKLIEHNQPKVDAHDAFMESGNALSMEQAGKSLSIGRNTLIRTLQHNGLLSKYTGLPYQQYMNAGYFRVKQVMTPVGNKNQVFITPKGMGYITSKIIRNAA